MFGKPEWFREKSVGWGVRPASWQGWGYAAAWAGAIALPFAVLVLRHQAPESLVWLTATSGLLLWDVTDIRRTLRAAIQKQVLYIGEEENSEPAV